MTEIDFTKTHAIVVEIGDRCFIRIIEGGYYFDGKTLAVNGKIGLCKAPTDDSFFVFYGPHVDTLQKITPPRRIVTKYVLRDDLKGSPKEEVISVDQRAALSEADQCLYSAVHEDIPQQAEDIPFLVQREDGEPSALPFGVVSTDKNAFARFKSFQHLGPVMARHNYVLWRLALRVQEIAQHNPLIAFSSGWGRDLDKYLKETAYKSFFIEVRKMEVNGITVAAQGLKTHYTTDPADSRTSYALLVQAVAGENLADLEAKVSAYVNKLTEPLVRWANPNTCPCCKRSFDPKSKGIRRLVEGGQ